MPYLYYKAYAPKDLSCDTIDLLTYFNFLLSSAYFVNESSDELG